MLIPETSNAALLADVGVFSSLGLACYHYHLAHVHMVRDLLDLALCPEGVRIKALSASLEDVVVKVAPLERTKRVSALELLQGVLQQVHVLSVGISRSVE